MLLPTPFLLASPLLRLARLSKLGCYTGIRYNNSIHKFLSACHRLIQIPEFSRMVMGKGLSHSPAGSKHICGSGLNSYCKLSNRHCIQIQFEEIQSYYYVFNKEGAVGKKRMCQSRTDSGLWNPISSSGFDCLVLILSMFDLHLCTRVTFSSIPVYISAAAS